jgi:hypothetical protein
VTRRIPAVGRRGEKHGGGPGGEKSGEAHVD